MWKLIPHCKSTILQFLKSAVGKKVCLWFPIDDEFSSNVANHSYIIRLFPILHYNEKNHINMFEYSIFCNLNYFLRLNPQNGISIVKMHKWLWLFIRILGLSKCFLVLFWSSSNCCIFGLELSKINGKNNNLNTPNHLFWRFHILPSTLFWDNFVFINHIFHLLSLISLHL